jgi:hypothetical protein
VLFAQGFFIELAFHHPQCGWFYRRNMTGFRKKNCGFNFRRAKKEFPRYPPSFTLPAKEPDKDPSRIPAIALHMSL